MAMTPSTENWTYSDMLAKLPAESRYELRNYHLMICPLLLKSIRSFNSN